jgi:hypothetical protein
MKTISNEDRKIVAIIRPDGEKVSPDTCAADERYLDTIWKELDGALYRLTFVAEIGNPSSGKVLNRVPILHRDEAKATISRNYGFECGKIRITGICWYRDDDYNHLEFAVRGWNYVVDDFGPLAIVRAKRY